MRIYRKFSILTMVVSAFLVCVIHFGLSGFVDLTDSLKLLAPAAAGVIIYDILSHFKYEAAEQRD